MKATVQSCHKNNFIIHCHTVTLSLDVMIGGWQYRLGYQEVANNSIVLYKEKKHEPIKQNSMLLNVVRTNRF